MLVNLFRGPGRIFAVTDNADGSNLPTRYGAWTAIKSLQMNRGDTIPGVVVEECLDDIATYGFHVTDAHVRITEQAAGA